MKHRIATAAVGLILLASLGGVQAGTLTADNIDAVKNVRVFGNFSVLEGDLPINADLFYSFTYASTNTVADESSLGNNGTLTGATWATNVPPGKPGGSYKFGPGRYITVSQVSGLKLTSTFSLSAWILPTNSVSDYMGIIVKGASYSDSEYGLGWYNGQVVFNSNAQLILSGNHAPLNAWSHVVAVLEGTGVGQAKIYVNGQLVYQGTLGLPDGNTTQSLYVGRWRSGCVCDFPGYIDDPLVFPRALSADEVGTLYSNGWSFASVPTNALLSADDVSVTIKRLTPQGDIGMGSFTNGP